MSDLLTATQVQSPALHEGSSSGRRRKLRRHASQARTGQERLVPAGGQQGETSPGRKTEQRGPHVRKKYGTKSQITRMAPPQIFLKEELYQLLEGKRDRLLNVAAMTLQRYARMFFVRKNFVKFRRRIIVLEARCKGYVVRYAAHLELMFGIDFSISPFVFQAAPPRSPQAPIKVGCEGLLSVCTVEIFPFFKRHGFRNNCAALSFFCFVLNRFPPTSAPRCPQ